MNESYSNYPPSPDQDPASNSPHQPQMQVRVSVKLPLVQPILTYMILGAIVVIFFYSQTLETGSRVPRNSNISSDELCTCTVCILGPQDTFVCDWAKNNAKIYDGEYYRLVTAMFLHIAPTHIFFNGLALYFFGREIERLFGYGRFLLVYFLGGIAGSVGSLLYTDATSIGASGGIFALFGAYGVYLYQHRHLYGERANSQLREMVFLALLNLFLGVAIPNIDNAAHIAGLASGIFLAWFIAPEFELRQDESLIQPRLYAVDVNTINRWIAIPVLFAGVMAASVIYAASVFG